MNNTPLVTIAMVTYNSDKYIRIAIESVLSSNYSNFELIIADDLSTDNTWQIIQTFNDPRIRAHQNKINKGEYFNRNKCIDLAKGDYLIFVDGDDYIFPESIDKCVKYYCQFPEVAFMLAASTRQSMIYPIELMPKDSLLIHFFIEPLFNHSFLQACFSIKHLRNNNNLATKFIAGDYHIFLKLANNHSFLLINAPLGWWRIHEQQASKKLLGIGGILDNYRIIQDILPTNTSLTSSQKKEILNKYIKQFAKYLIKHPRHFKSEHIKMLLNYSFRTKKSRLLSYSDLGYSLPITKDIAKNPFSIKSLL